MEINIADGGEPCWGFLSCLEVINILSQYKDPATTDAHALHTAPLWAYARDKVSRLICRICLQDELLWMFAAKERLKVIYCKFWINLEHFSCMIDEFL